MAVNTGTLYTVGHSNHQLEHFRDLLRRHAITVLIDVRSVPYSRYSPHFNRESLQDAVTSSGVRYVYAGEYLGGRPESPECYDEQGQVDYARIATQPFYQRGIRRLLDYIRAERTAIMCSEEDPIVCHRHRLITQTVLARGIPVLHIRRDGRLEPARPIPRQANMFS